MTDRPESKLRLRPGVTDAAVLLVLLSPALTDFRRFADDPGLGWHLATGKWIVDNGAVPTVDPFLAGTPPLEWVCDQWLSDVLLHLTYASAGWVGMYALLTAIYLATYFVFVQRTASVTAGTWLGGALAAMVCLKLGTVHFIARPVIIAFFFFAITYGICARIADRLEVDPEFGRTGLLRAAAPLPFVFLLWANFHPSFILGLVIVATAALAFLLDPLFFADKREHESGYHAAAGRMALILVACLVASALNPRGFVLHHSIITLAGSEYFARLNLEWHSPDFLEDANQITMFVFLFIAGVRYLAAPTTNRWRLFELAAVVGFTVGYLRSVRFLPFLSIVLAVPLARALKDLSHVYLVQWMELLQKPIAHIAALERWEAQSSRGLVGVVAGLVVIGAVAVSGELPRGETPGPSEDEFPHEAMRLLRESGEQVVVYAGPNVGGFVTFYGEGRVKPLLDDRNTMLGEEPYREVFDVLNLSRPDWSEKLHSSGATHAIVQTKSPIDFALRDAGREPLAEHPKYTLYTLISPK